MTAVLIQLSSNKFHLVTRAFTCQWVFLLPPWLGPFFCSFSSFLMGWTNFISASSVEGSLGACISTTVKLSIPGLTTEESDFWMCRNGTIFFSKSAWSSDATKWRRLGHCHCVGYYVTANDEQAQVESLGHRKFFDKHLYLGVLRDGKGKRRPQTWDWGFDKSWRCYLPSRYDAPYAILVRTMTTTHGNYDREKLMRSWGKKLQLRMSRSLLEQPWILRREVG